MSETTQLTTEINIWADVEESYKILSQLGERGYGTVKKARSIASGNLVAIKHLTNFSYNKYYTLKVFREILIMKALQKLNTWFFPQLQDLIVSEDCDHVFLVTELETTDIRSLICN